MGHADGVTRDREGVNPDGGDDADDASEGDAAEETMQPMAPVGIAVARVDAEYIRGSVASKLFGVEADPVKIGRFTVLKRLGAGGMGVVYAAYDDQLDRKLAVKLLRSSAPGQEQHARLLREAQSLARLSHPNVIHVYEVGTFRGQVFVAMEFVEGRTLREYEPEPQEDRTESILRVFGEAGRGLAAAHEAGLVHRDFKPDNALVGDDGRVRVLDFGLARAVEESDRAEVSEQDPAGPIGPETAEELARKLANSGGLTRTGAIMGTPAYMSPEQFRSGKTDARTDQFSFCVALWEKLYGERPFAGADPFALALAVTKGELREIPEGRRIPRRLHQVLERGLAVGASERFPSMEALLEQLETKDRRPGRWWVPAAVVLGLGLGGLAVAMAMPEEVSPCLTAGDEFAGVWDAESRASMEGAFRKSSVSGRLEAWDSTRRALDEYTQRWVEVQLAACEESRQESRGGTELYGQRLVCLGQRRHELEALATLLVTADDNAVRRSVVAVSSLPSVDDCLDSETLARSFGKVEEMQGEDYEAFERLLARGAGHVSLGEYDDAVRVADEAVSAARVLGSERAVGRAHVLLGHALLRNREADEARASLHEGLRQADKAGDDETRARATIYLIWAANQKGDYQGGDELAADALAMLERVGDDPLLEAELYKQWGNLAIRQRNGGAAAERHRRALELYEIHLGKGHVSVGVSLTNLGYALVAERDYAGARALFERAVTIFEEHLGPQHSHLGRAVTGMGNSYNNEARAIALSDPERSRKLFKEAARHYQRAIEIKSSVFGPDHINVAAARNNYAEALRHGGDGERLADALEQYEKALAVRRSHESKPHPEMVMPMVGIGRVKIEMGDLEGARAILEEARKIHEADAKDDPVTANVGDLYVGLAIALDEVDRPRALGYGRRVAAAYRAATGPYAAERARIEAWLEEREPSAKGAEGSRAP
jgi:tetratricopeptide (TPR) repeat protein/predicted Ser/Thr protein kinase